MLKVILIGAGNRGIGYTNIMAKSEGQFQVIAVAEPVESRRNLVRDKHGIPQEMCFADWKPLLELGKIADIAIICTMDRDHYEPAMKAIACKYDILLEKPVSPEPEECEKIASYAEKMGVKIVVCHVLRYSPFFMTIKKLLEEGRVGNIMSINHEECVGNVHQSHSFVRGNWGNSENSSCMLLQKSCHDMDILQWLIGKKCKKVQSFGSLAYFKRENAPEGAPEYCIEGCPNADRCPYNAVKLYLEDKENEWFRTTCTKEANPTDEMVEKAIRTTQYGKCVYKCDNDVVDHQTVNLLFEDDVTVTFTMNAFNQGGRFIHIMGTKGEIRGSMASEDTPIMLFDFETRETYEIPASGKDGLVNGHGGGDEGIVESLYAYLSGTYAGNSVSDIRTSVNNHLIVFAAEEARKSGTVIDLEKYAEQMMLKELVAENFNIPEKVTDVAPYGSGHINDTYVVNCEMENGEKKRYILQRMNTDVFKDVDGLMQNVVHVTGFLKEKIAASGGDVKRETLTVIPAKSGEAYLSCEAGKYRMYEFIEGALGLDAARNAEDFYNSAVIFGDFQRLLADFPAATLHETIRNFHNTVSRFENLKKAVEEDVCGRKCQVEAEILFVMEREADCRVICDALAKGEIPLRVTHNDTKLNNVMIDAKTGKGVCVIDLDTVMPGSALYDYGDSIRFGASTAAEDEVDLGKVACSMELFEVYTKGYLEGCAGSLTEREIRLLPMGAKLMTLECGMRFLTDYLQGDTYFKIHRENHNLDRARTQFKLVADMEEKWEEMSKIVERYC